MNRDTDIMARTIYGEARGEYYVKDGGINSLIAVGNVIMNRSRERSRSISSICLKPKQFSCWNKTDPNFKVIQNVTFSDKIFQLCYSVSCQIINGQTPDITNGANHYYSKKIKTVPYWAYQKIPIKTIGNHIFFRI